MFVSKLHSQQKRNKMNKPSYLLSIVLIICSITIQAQSTFSKTDYENFLKQNSSMTYEDASDEYPLPQTYYKNDTAVNLYKYNYFDSLEIKYSLTKGEKDLIQQNGFMVSERLSYNTFEEAFRDIFHKDMPVFLSTDAVLFALHASYDNILKEMEVSVMEPNIKAVLDALYLSYPALKAKYQSHPELKTSLNDIDLYITVARSLMYNQTFAPHDTTQGSVNNILSDVKSENLVTLDLFGIDRYSDFSQFTPRGHYLDINLKTGKTLESYFKTMMWLGRIDFWLTGNSRDTTKKYSKEIKRNTYDALLLNELLQSSNNKKLLDENDSIISFLVGKSDNLTPNQLSKFQNDEHLTNIIQLEDTTFYKNWYNKLDTCVAFEQQIMSDVKMDFEKSPVSFRLMGQRFIIDSYVFTNLTFSRIGPLRMLPKPLDISFVFGNNNALPLLKSEVVNYGIAPNYVALRKTVDSYDSTFWAQTLYNTWFQAIRDLNPNTDTTHLPFFMTTAGWQHEKMNTQLASWAQLRHDNLLYAKQSYSDMWLCSYPFSYVEPYPIMYNHVKQFAENAKSFFNAKNASISNYFTRLSTLMDTLESISTKELQQKPLNASEISFLQRMILIKLHPDAYLQGQKEEVSGWYLDMIFNKGDIIQETVIADVHTAPMDNHGAIVGNVLHVATGKVNLGVFMSNAPLPDGRMMAFVGPVMSYYEKITDGFKRLTDQEWRDSVAINKIPLRPYWTSIYLANKSGNISPAGPELPSQSKAWKDSHIYDAAPISRINNAISIAPNPLNNNTNLITQFEKETIVNIEIFDLSGRVVFELKKLKIQAGNQLVQLLLSQLSKGIYFCNVSYDNCKKTIKLIKQ